MDKLISQQAAIDALKELTANGTNKGMVFGEDAVHRIEMLPSAQPDIIRCKDCKYYREYGYVNGKPKFLPRCAFSAIYVDADDFCSKAERREQDE